MASEYLLGASAQRFTTEIVGEQYHPAAEKVLHDLAAAEGGTCELKFTLIPEPDNPYDDHAISVRYRDQVAGYIPRSRNRQIWSAVTRVQASGYVPTIRGRVEAWPNGTSASVSLALGGTQKILSSELGLKPKKTGGYTPPPAYQAATSSTGFRAHAVLPPAPAKLNTISLPDATFSNGTRTLQGILDLFGASLGMPTDEKHRDKRQNALLAFAFVAVHLFLFIGIPVLFSKAYVIGLTLIAIAFVLFFTFRALNMRSVKKGESPCRPPVPADSASEDVSEDGEEWD